MVTYDGAIVHGVARHRGSQDRFSMPFWFTDFTAGGSEEWADPEDEWTEGLVRESWRRCEEHEVNREGSEDLRRWCEAARAYAERSGWS